MINDLYSEFTKDNFKVTSAYKDEEIDKAIVLH